MLSANASMDNATWRERRRYIARQQLRVTLRNHGRTARASRRLVMSRVATSIACWTASSASWAERVSFVASRCTAT